MTGRAQRPARPDRARRARRGRARTRSARVEAHAAECAVCREELAALRATADALAIAVPQVEPPDSLKASLMSTVRAEAPARAAAAGVEAEPSRRPTSPRPALVASRLAAPVAGGRGDRQRRGAAAGLEHRAADERARRQPRRPDARLHRDGGRAERHRPRGIRARRGQRGRDDEQAAEAPGGRGLPALGDPGRNAGVGRSFEQQAGSPDARAVASGLTGPTRSPSRPSRGSTGPRPRARSWSTSRSRRGARGGRRRRAGGVPGRSARISRRRRRGPRVTPVSSSTPRRGPDVMLTAATGTRSRAARRLLLRPPGSGGGQGSLTNDRRRMWGRASAPRGEDAVPDGVESTETTYSLHQPWRLLDALEQCMLDRLRPDRSGWSASVHLGHDLERFFGVRAPVSAISARCASWASTGASSCASTTPGPSGTASAELTASQTAPAPIAPAITAKSAALRGTSPRRSA